MHKKHLLIIMALASAGCATTGMNQVSKGQELLASSPKVISSLDQLSYQQVNFGKPIKFAFDEQTTILQEGGKRHFAKGFALPIGRGSYSVSITSYKGGTLHDPAIMYPEVQVLDKDYRVIRTLPHTGFVFRLSLSGEGLNTVFFVNENSQGERFLLITNCPMDEADLISSQVNNTSEILVPIPVPVPFGGGFLFGFFFIPIPTGSNTPPIKMKASSTGQIEVEFQEYRPKRITETGVHWGRKEWGHP